MELQIAYTEEFKLFEKEFRNWLLEETLTYDTKTGKSVSFSYGKGKNFDSDLEKITGSIDVNIVARWNVEYSVTKFWLYPDFDERTSWLQTLISID